MKLEIIVMFQGGQAFLLDQETNIEYCMNRIEEKIRRTEVMDSHPMNLQFSKSLNNELYKGKTFQTFEDAQRFINRIAIQDNIESLRKSTLSSDKKDKLIKLYQEILQEYQ